MDVVWLSRLQFAAATYFHFLFVPLTLGLSLLIALMETRFARGGDPVWQRQARFWGQLFLINFAVGIVTGITLEFQFGTNWSRYSAYVGDIFGSLLAIEATAAFFLESTFIGIWIFGWKKLSAKAHAIVMWMVAIASNLSALWILTANAWMQHPVGYTVNQTAGRAELTDFLAVITQRAAIMKIAHTLSGAYVLAAFFVMGISAYHLLRRQHQDFFGRSFRLALGFGLIFSLVELAQGHMHAADVAEMQPTKLAAMESHWETGPKAPIYLFSIPDEEAGRNSVAILPLPGALSLLAFHNPNAVVQGLADFPKEDRPPVLVTYVAFRIMVALGAYFVGVTLLGWWLRRRLEESPWYLRLVLFSLPLPYLAIAMGWTVAEVGRQPWIVYGLMRTRDAASPIASGQVLATLVGLVVVYGLLGVVAAALMVRIVRKGPAGVPASGHPVAKATTGDR